MPAPDHPVELTPPDISAYKAGNTGVDYVTTNRDGFREYKSDSKQCLTCPLLEQCTQSKTHIKTLHRHVWEEHKEAIIEHRYETRGKALYKRRKETVERSFADAKQLHGHRYARLRGRDKVQEQCLLAAACQNIKKIALLLNRKPQYSPHAERTSETKSLYALLRSILHSITRWTITTSSITHYPCST